MPADLAEAPISRQEFLALHRLADHAPRLRVALEFLARMEEREQGPVSRARLTRVFKQVSGQELSSRVMDILEYVYDDGRGRAQWTRVMDALNRRMELGRRRGGGMLVADADGGSGSGGGGSGGIASWFASLTSPAAKS